MKSLSAMMQASHLKSPQLIGLVLAGLLLARALALWLGIDHLTTVSWGTPLSLGIAAIVGMAVWLILFLYHRRGTGNSRSDEPNDIWVRQPALSLFGTGVISIAVSWAMGSLLGVAAQYLTGTTLRVPATVANIASFHSARVVCRSKVTVTLDNGGNTMTFCFLLVGGEGNGPADLQPGEHVLVQLRNTPLGKVAESVSRSDSLSPSG